MAENFKHQEYRDQLAEDLVNIDDHEERRKALEHEKGGWRYKMAEERHIPEIANLREQKRIEKETEERKARIEKIKKEIYSELKDVPVGEIIDAHPEISEEIEVIPLKKDGYEVVLLRDRAVPEIAFPIFALSELSGRTSGHVYVDFPDSRLPEGESMRMDYNSICTCCSPETQGIESPFEKNRPDLRKFSDVNKWSLAVAEWEKTDEGQKDAEWREQKKQEFHQLMQKTCTDNGIQVLKMRKAEGWERSYGPIAGVDFRETGEDGSGENVSRNGPINKVGLANPQTHKFESKEIRFSFSR